MNVVLGTTLEYKIYVSGFWRYHQNKYQIHKCDIAIIIGENCSTTVCVGYHSRHFDNIYMLQLVIMNAGWWDITDVPKTVSQGLWGIDRLQRHFHSQWNFDSRSRDAISFNERFIGLL